MLLVSCIRLEGSGSCNIFLSDVEFVIDYFGSCVGVYVIEDMLSMVCLVMEDEDLGWFWEVVEEDELYERWNSVKGD